MTQEEKAKAYDEALENARKLRDDYQKELDKTDKNSQLASILKASISAVEMVFPQVTESDDERIRKELIEFLTDIKEISESGRTVWAVREEDVEMCKSSIAYLEKQKYNRMQPVYDNQESFESALDKAWKAYNDCGSRTVDSCEDDYIESAYAKGFREGYLFGLEKQKEPENTSASTMAPSCWEVEQKEQKPCWNPTEEDVALFNKAITTNASLSPQERAKLDIIRMKFKHRSVIEQKEQKPVSFSCGHENDVDWSEEDKKMLLSIINAFRNGTVSTIGQEQWLKNLPKRINPQPKPEWSEEDGEMLDSIIRVVCGVGIQPNGLREKQVSWLKSLRPSWKPSKEQMEALRKLMKYAVSLSSYYDIQKEIESLYNDLNKLK